MSEKPLQHLSCPLVVLKINEAEVRGDPLADAMRSEMLAVYLQSNAQHAVLDFSGVTYLASTGFRPLLSLNRVVRQRQGRLVLCGLNPDVAEVFAVTRLIDTSGVTRANSRRSPTCRRPGRSCIALRTQV